MKRPPVERWEMWRDQLFNREIHSWYYFYDFWMQGGFMEHKNETHSKCKDLDIECQPQTLVDFENMFSKNLNDDFLKIGNVLDASTDVEVVSDQARACVLGNMMNRTDHQDLNMHQASRPFPDLPHEYLFKVPQFDRMFNRTYELRNKVSVEPLSLKPLANELVRVLNKYIAENSPEFLFAIDKLLEEFVTDVLHDAYCANSVGNELTVCNFMKDWNNHDIFTDGFYPDNFSYDDWLKEQSILI